MKKAYPHFILLLSDVNAIISFLSCDEMNRFDKILANKRIIHFAITSKWLHRNTVPDWGFGDLSSLFLYRSTDR